MKIWQVDFYHFPSNLNPQQRQWQLLICDRQDGSVYSERCDSNRANSQWLEQQLNKVAAGKLPDKIQVFRPQALGILTLAAEKLGIKVEATRHTNILKQELLKQSNSAIPNYNPLAIEKPPPQPLSEELWGEKWQIANIPAGDLISLFSDRPIPICEIPEEFLPINLGIASNILVPGIVIYGGRKSMIIARWLEQKQPAFIQYIPTEIGKSGGLILETGLADRWVCNTFESEFVASAAKDYEQKKQESQGLHFLLIQPDDSGRTYTGFWLLKEE